LSDARREHILNAALEVFLERGIQAASIEDIRERSGASVGSLYHRFGSKEGIAAAVYVAALADYQRQFLALLREDRSTEETVKATVRAHLRWVQRNPDRAAFLFMGREADAHELNDGFFEHVRAWIDPRVAAGELRDAPLGVLNALWVGPSQELARHWLAGGRRGSLTKHANALADAAWRSLEAP